MTDQAIDGAIAVSERSMSATTLDAFVCPWCEEAGLRVEFSMQDSPNGAGAYHSQGYRVVCAEPDNNCPDTTGVFPTKCEAIDAAATCCREMGQVHE